jgi:hypothetical protein
MAPKPILNALHDSHLPLRARLNGQRGVLAASAANGDWALLTLAARARPKEVPIVVGRHLKGVERSGRRLKALNHLRDLVHRPWPKSVHVEELKAGVAAFAETASRPLAGRMRRYIALRAKMEGKPNFVRRLLRPGETLDESSVLRDLQALEEVSATPPPVSPLGDLPLPEPEPLGFKASVRESLTEDFPSLVDDLPATELRARRGATRAIETSAGTQWNHLSLHLHNLKSMASSYEQDDREDDVERQLGRSLKPEERLLGRRLLRTKKTAEVASALRSLHQK